MTGLPEPLVVLSATTVRDYLRDRGFDVGDRSIELLAGGVSGVVFAVGAPHDLVVKQALPTLAVEAEWTATMARANTEARALAFVGRITPANVPCLLDSDERNYALVMTRAPAAWANWRERLLDGGSDEDVERGRQVGGVLAEWHAATRDDPAVAAAFGDDEAFEQLRVDPFYRQVLRVHPALQHPLDHLIDEVTGARECLVHGDFSPKNILIGPDRPWILDFEVARYGAGVFDVAFMLSHLLLKTVHVTGRADRMRAVASAFLDAYGRRLDTSPTLGWHVAALALARVDGKSPANYLTADERVAIRGIAMDALADDRPTVDQIWDRAVPGGAAE